MAATELGQKQICPHCTAKFYDLNKRPAVCPKCQTAFDPEEAVRNRRIRTRAPDYEDDEKEDVVVAPADDELEEEKDETPEIDEAAAAEPLETDEDVEDPEAGPAPPAGEDIGVDFAEEEEGIEGAEDDDAVPFLEDDDEEGFDGEDIEGLPGEDEERER